MRPRIVTADYRDAHQASAVIATAFRDLAVASWLVPEAKDQQRVLYAYTRILVDHAIDHGTVLMAEDGSAAAVWLPRELPLPSISDYEQQLQSACGEYSHRFHDLDRLSDKYSPKEPHDWLALLAVKPDRQCQGLGTALLNRYQRILERSGTPAYVQASGLAARRLFMCQGYTDYGGPMNLPDHGPQLWPMWKLSTPLSGVPSTVDQAPPKATSQSR